MSYEPRLTDLFHTLEQIDRAKQAMHEGLVARKGVNDGWIRWQSDTDVVRAALDYAQQEVRLQITRLLARRR